MTMKEEAILFSYKKVITKNRTHPPVTRKNQPEIEPHLPTSQQNLDPHSRFKRNTARDKSKPSRRWSHIRVRNQPEPEFLNVKGAQELIPRNRFRQPM